MPLFGKESTEQLNTAHPDLQRLFCLVVKTMDCKVLCGHRDEYEQNKAYDLGLSKLKYPKSKHNTTPAKAVDVVPYFSMSPHIRWDDIKTFYYFAGYVKATAQQLGIKVRWGGDWDGDNDLNDQDFMDMTHWELVG